MSFSKENFGLGGITDKGTLNAIGNTAGVLSVGSSALEGIMGYQSAMGQARVLDQNAASLDQSAKQTLIDSGINGRRARHNQADTVSQASAALGARGMTADGSGGRQGLSLAQQAEVAINDAAGKAVQEAQIINYQADLKRWEARQTRKAAKWGVLSSAINSAAKVGGTLIGGPIGGQIGSIAAQQFTQR